MRRFTHTGLVICLWSLTFLYFSCSESNQDETKSNTSQEIKAKLIYFSIPGWPYCKKVSTIVNGLEDEYNGTLKVEELPTTNPESKKLITQYQLTTHGMLIFDEKGNLVKKLDGHFLEESEIRTAVKEVVGK